MRLFESSADLRSCLAAERLQGHTIGFVPTMGKLHQGHARLIEVAAERTSSVVVSIFVNPLQFGPGEDFQRYPRDLEGDLELCRGLGVGAVFAPPLLQMYPQEQWTTVEVEKVAEHLCGKFRPGHFRGVATVVLKLLNVVQPDQLFMGEKDAQQLALIRRMVTDLLLPVTVVGVPTVREPDGLAISSRNGYLSPEERKAGPALFRALQAGRRAVLEGSRDPAQVRQAVVEALKLEPRVRIEYVEAVDPSGMQPVDQIQEPFRLCAAIWLGTTRLIDNLLITPDLEAKVSSGFGLEIP